MAHLRTFRSSGVIPMSSGAAIAAMKARAAAWDLSVIENEGELRVALWGCELRLIQDGASMRVDLSGPEARLIGNLRETTADVLAEVGLTVSWDQIDVGALAPGLSLMRVVSVSRRSPNFLRVRLQGDDSARFSQGSLHFRLLVPPVGRVPVWPRVAETGRTVWPDGPDALHRPVYTVAAQAGDWLDFDIFLHDGSPTCDWALTRAEGSEVAIIGPGGGWCPEADRLFLFGDETAVPAIARMLDLAQGEVRAVVRAKPEDLGPLAADPRLRFDDDLLGALAATQIGEGSHVWFAASADEARQARQDLLARKISKKDFMAAAYWG
jgi:NADPH-dependent ferric siderophore reductase